MRPHRTVLLAVACLLLATSGRVGAQGAWRPLSPPVLPIAAGAYDAGRDAYVVVSPAEEVWVHDVAAQTPWTRVVPQGIRPISWRTATVLDDPARDRHFVVIEPGDGGPLQVWQLTVGVDAAWSFVAGTTGGPEGRVAMSVVYDPVRQRLVFFGGGGPHPEYGPVTWSDVWALELSGAPTWVELAPAGAGPTPAARAPAILDETRRRLVVRVGQAFWGFDLDGGSGWTALPATGFPSLSSVQMVADPARDRILVYALEGVPPADYTSAVWTLPLAGGTASRIEATGNPGPLVSGALLLDPARSRLVLYGGTGTPTYRGASWYSDRTQWLDLVGTPVWHIAGPPLEGLSWRVTRSAVRDPVRPRLLSFGLVPIQHDLTSDRGWSTWSFAPGSPTPPFEVHTPVVDSRRGQVLAFSPQNLSELWILDPATDTWSTRTATNLPEGLVEFRTAVVDSLHDRLVLIGSGLDPVFQVVLGMAWTLPLGVASPAWTPLATAGTAPRFANTSGPVAIADSRRNRIILLAYANQVWELDFTGEPTWTRLADFPIFLTGPVVAHDPLGDRVLVFFASLFNIPVSQLWSWPLGSSPATAQQLLPGQAPPPTNSGWRGAFDRATNRLLVLERNVGLFAFEADAASPVPGLEVGCPPDRNVVAGTSFVLPFRVTAGTAGGIVDYTLTSERPWPGFPRSGALALAPGEVRTFDVEVTVPAAEPGGANVVVFNATPRAGGGPRTCAVTLQVSSSPPVPGVDVACPPAVIWIPGGIAHGDFPVTVTSSGATSLAWTLTSARAWPGFPLGGNVPITAGVATVGVDIAVPDSASGGSHGLRLTVRPVGEAEQDSCSWTLVAPGGPAGSTRSWAVGPNPSDGAVDLRLALLGEAAVRIEVRQLATGRLVRSRDLGRIGPGASARELWPGAPLPTGAYAVRVWLDGMAEDRKLIVVR